MPNYRGRIMAKYKLQLAGVKDTEKNLFIPNAQGNLHWQEYQTWLAQGNTPDPVDPEPDPETGLAPRQKIKRRLLLEYDAQEILLALIEKEAGDTTVFNEIKSRALEIKAEV
jgi:hypothetical protein